nr:hypothetical protein BHI3_36650 [Bacteriovorax sp. HI3]
MKIIVLFTFMLLSLTSCFVDQGKIAINIKRKVAPSSTSPSNISSATVSSVQVINNQLVITGTGLSGVSDVKVSGNSLNQNFTIESQTATQIIANSVSAFSFDVSKIFNLILSDAQAAATFPIDFSLCNSTLNGHGFNCSIPVQDKDVLSYDQASGKWKPRSINGLSYQGAWDANDPEPTGASAGDYYIVSEANSPYAVGDWIVWNGTGYDRINNSNAITTVFGRVGAVVATEGDYNLDKLFDVDLTIAPVAGKVLKYNGTKWVAGDDLSGGGAGSVTSAEIANGAVTDAKIDTVSASKITGTISSSQITDGTIVNADISATAAIDYSKLNIPNGSIPYAKLNIANGDIPAAKISGLPSATSVLTTTITDGDTTHAPDGNAVYDALATKLNTTGGTLSVGTITGVPSPVNPSDVANKSYVDSAIAAAVPSLDTDDVPEGSALYFTEARVRATALTGLNTGAAGPIAATDTVLSAAGKLQYQITDLKANGQWTKTGNDISYSAGNVTIDKMLLLKDSGTNHVEIKAPSTVTSTYTLTLPSTAGTNNYVLKTDGTGILSWVAMNDASVQSFAKSALPNCSAGEVLKSNGTSFSCVTDATGAGSFTGTNNRAVATDGSGALTTSATTAVELGYVSGVTSSIQTQLDAKQASIAAGTSSQYYRGDKTWATLDTSIVSENTNLYFTAARAKSAAVADAINDGTTDVAPSQNAVYDALANKLSLSGGTLIVGTISGVPDPTNDDDVANKGYVDDALAASGSKWTLTGSDIYRNSKVRIGGTSAPFYTLEVTGTAQISANSASLRIIPGQYYSGGATVGGQPNFVQIDASPGNTKTINFPNNVAVTEGYLGAGTASPVERLDVVGNARITGNLRLKDNGVNYVEFKAPSTVTSTYVLTFPATAGSANQVLQTNGSGVLSWVDSADTSVQAFAKSALPNCSAGQVLKSDGTSFSCVTDATGAGAFTGTVSRAVATDGSGALTTVATTATELGYVNGVTSPIQTQLDAKQATITAGTSTQYYRGDKTWATLDTSVVTENTNLYFTQARVLATPLTGFSATNSVIAATDTILQGFNKAQGQLSAHTTSLSSKADQTNLTQTITAAAITGLSSPIAGSDAANKTYVDNAISGNGVWAKSSSNIYFNTGNVGIGTTSPNSTLDVNGTIRATQICDSAGSNCKTISSGWGSASASMVASWPDAIYCTNGSDSSILYHDTRESASNLEYYSKASAGHYIRFNATTGAFYDNTAFTGNAVCTGKSISTLVSEGRTFGLLGGGIDWTVSGSNIYRSSGRVGIGTSNPTVDLDIVGSVTGFSQTRSVNSPAAPDLFFQKDRGTPGSPAALSSGDALGHISFKGYDGASYIRGARIASLTTGAPATNQMTADLEFYTNNGSSDATERMRIEANGNIGVGTSVSSSYQHGGTNRVLTLHNPGTAQHSQSHLVVSTGSTVASSSIGSLTAALPSSSATNKGVAYVGFATGPNSTAANPTAEILMATRGASDTNWAQRLIINESGNVGIGTSIGAPLQRLQVQGVSGAQTLLQVNNNDFSNSTSAGSGAYIGTYGASGDVASMVQAFRAGNTAAAPLLLNPFSGVVGVNNPTPSASYSLDVNGSARINSIKGGQLNGAGNFHVDASGTGAFYVNWSAGTGGLYVGNGTNSAYAPVYASAFNVSSDRSLKKNITAITNPLDIILNINGVKFNWINEKESKDRQVGVIAQDVQKVLPEVVTVNKQTKKLTVNYASLVAPIIEAIKDFYRKWFDDSATIHREIASLKEENAQMKSYLCKKDPDAPFCTRKK